MCSEKAWQRNSRSNWFCEHPVVDAFEPVVGDKLCQNTRTIKSELQLQAWLNAFQYNQTLSTVQTWIDFNILAIFICYCHQRHQTVTSSVPLLLGHETDQNKLRARPSESNAKQVGESQLAIKDDRYIPCWEHSTSSLCTNYNYTLVAEKKDAKQ